jgi:hypothetical protein
MSNSSLLSRLAMQGIVTDWARGSWRYARSAAFCHHSLLRPFAQPIHLRIHSNPNPTMIDGPIRSHSLRCYEVFQTCFLHKNFRDDTRFGDFRAKFILWTTTLGVFASELASADRRLQEHVEIKGIISGLLTDLETSLNLCRMSYR